MANRDKVPFKKKLIYEFKSIPELRRTDADVVLWIISINGVNYYEPVHDPLFTATSEISIYGMTAPVFRPDAPAGTMACTVQVRLQRQ